MYFTVFHFINHFDRGPISFTRLPNVAVAQRKSSRTPIFHDCYELQKGFEHLVMNIFIPLWKTGGCG